MDVADRDNLSLDDVVSEGVDYRLREVLIEREQAAHAIDAYAAIRKFALS